MNSVRQMRNMPQIMAGLMAGRAKDLGHTSHIKPAFAPELKV